MVIRVSDLSRLYKFPMGRAEFALREVDRRARPHGRIDIADLARRGANEAQEAMSLGVAAQAVTRALYPPETTAVASLVDHSLSGFAGYLNVQVRSFPNEPRAFAARRIERAILPAGVGAISALSYAEKHAAINNLSSMAADPKLAPDIALLPECAELLDRLRARNSEFGELLHKNPEAPSSDDIAKAEARAQETLVATVFLIVGMYARQLPVNTEERDHLLEPVLKQNQALRLAYRRRRAVTDVDPQTGEEQPPAQPPSSTPIQQPPSSSPSATL